LEKGGNSNMKDIGNKIRDLRNKNGDSLEELGKKLNFNYSNLSKIERGVRSPSLELLEQISKLYEVRISYFFGEEGTLPKELEERGAKWIAFGDKMEQRELTPEQIEATLEFLDKMGLGKKPQ
jgi:transcriptional regulator with XRE-family HTH domain